MLWFTALASYGKERLWRSLYVPGVDFSLSESGEQIKLGRGGELNGPAILPKLTSDKILLLATAGASLTDWLLRQTESDGTPK